MCFPAQVIEFGELDKHTVRFLRQVLNKLLKETEPEDLVDIFSRWAILIIKKEWFELNARKKYGCKEKLELIKSGGELYFIFF